MSLDVLRNPGRLLIVRTASNGRITSAEQLEDNEKSSGKIGLFVNIIFHIFRNFHIIQENYEIFCPIFHRIIPGTAMLPQISEKHHAHTR